MAQNQRSSSSRSSNTRSTSNRGGSTQRSAARSNTASKNRTNVKDEPFNGELVNEIAIIGVFAFALFLFLCNFRILGNVGNTVSDIMFGLVGWTAYILPILLAYIVFFGVANRGNSKAKRRSFSLVILELVLACIGGLISVNTRNLSDGLTFTDVLKDTYEFSSNYENSSGGGVIGGLLAYYGQKGLGTPGIIILLLVIAIICIVILTERSFFSGVRAAKDTSKRAFDKSAQNARQHYLEREERRERILEERQRKQEEKQLRKEVAENDKILNMKEVSGVPTYNLVESDPEIKKIRDDIHEINLTNIEEEYDNRSVESRIHGIDYNNDTSSDEISEIFETDTDEVNTIYEEESDEMNEVFGEEEDEIILPPHDMEIKPSAKPIAKPERTVKSGIKKSGKYQKPPIDLLTPGKASKGSSGKDLEATARKLEEVLRSFNVEARVSEYSQGPSVTRYEMIPKTGVKVSKILSLADDIKLNLAAADIRIEAPIPGKAAIGIEVPNKESSMVAFRDLLESKEFEKALSKISFAVGKDLSGQVVVADIAKMPHMLIAGATGSGKSVCINTLIMSILYKADPDEVKMIMIDPKVVELSVYNGIPHLLIPVVTDPKKASASLAWAVREMDDRYQKFAEWGVRDLKGYNEKISGELDVNGEPLKPMFQLVVIVDELADLMMVAGKEVEESICRLAQLARAAGIHLIIATQRPSVDVITGLIKANMPSRVSFAVSSGVDSRTILDMNGAEKLLGKGDMLFYPQGYVKPARVQGAFISDADVSKVVNFLKDRNDKTENFDDIEQKISMMTSSSSSNVSSMTALSDEGMDEYYVEAGRLITQSGKCSIGMLQRKYKIGFNRAARIMDSLAENGVVSEEEGTKARTILMTPEEFEQSIQQ